MKLRILTSMLLVLMLSAFNSFTASAHDGGDCKSHCRSHWKHHHCWGHNDYIYGPDGYFAKHKKACCKKESSCKKEASCTKKCSGAMSCHKSSCGRGCHHTYRRAHYNEDCCGHSYLSYGCEKKCSKDNDDDNDD